MGDRCGGTVRGTESITPLVVVRRQMLLKQRHEHACAFVVHVRPGSIGRADIRGAWDEVGESPGRAFSGGGIDCRVCAARTTGWS